MNCKPGDLAVIVRGDAFTEYLGRIVRVTTLMDGFAWRTEESLDGNQDYAILVPDSCLRPLRDSGEGVKDETLGWLPVPTKEIV